MSDRAAVCDRPVFVVGAVRSGTTMLRLMLDSHPQICNFGEFEYVFRCADGDEFPEVAKYIQTIEADPAFRVNHFKIEPGLTYLELAHSFLRQAVERTEKPVISANVHSRMDLLPKIWPNARYVHLGRDPRDVSRSCIGMGWVGNVWHGADVWITAENRWQRLADSIAATDYLEVEFEKLVADPKRELGRICKFLELEYSDEMLSYPDHSTYAAPDRSLANQWKQKLTKREIQHVEHKCGLLMQSRGYAPQFDDSSVPFYERAVLGFQNRLKRWQFNINRYGLALYLQWQLAKHLGVPRFSWTREAIRRVEAIDEACLK